LVNWKNSFERVNTELDMTRKKKQTLDGLREAGRISQFAYECLNKGLTEEIEQVQAERKALTEKMSRKLNELEEQRIALEIFLANNEMAYASGELGEELHSKESIALDIGLEATKEELGWIKEAIIQLVPRDNESVASEAQTVAASSETAETTTEPLAERNETSANVPIEVPVEVTPAAGEVQAEQIQVPTESPTTPPATGNEGGDAPFREQGGDSSS
jgi:hypothetical protein